MTIIFTSRKLKVIPICRLFIINNMMKAKEMFSNRVKSKYFYTWIDINGKTHYIPLSLQSFLQFLACFRIGFIPFIVFNEKYWYVKALSNVNPIKLRGKNEVIVEKLDESEVIEFLSSLEDVRLIHLRNRIIRYEHLRKINIYANKLICELRTFNYVLRTRDNINILIDRITDYAIVFGKLRGRNVYLSIAVPPDVESIVLALS